MCSVRSGVPSASTGLPLRKRFRASDTNGTTARAEALANAHGSTLGLRGAAPEEGAQSLDKESVSSKALRLSGFHAVVDTVGKDRMPTSSNLQGDKFGPFGSHAVGVRQEPAALDNDPGAQPRRTLQPMHNIVEETLPGTQKINCTTPTFVEPISESHVVLRGNTVQSPTVETLTNPSAGSSDTSPRQQLPSVSASLSMMRVGGNSAPIVAHQDRPYPCTKCTLHFARRSNFKRHYKTVHLKQKPFACPQCQLAFGSKSGMALHVHTVHNKERKYHCNVCQRRFGRKSDFTKHISEVHLEVREHECRICGSRFARKSDMLKHVKSVHKKERYFVCEATSYAPLLTRPHRCAHCQKRFSQTSSLSRHVRNVHPGGGPMSEGGDGGGGE